MTGNSRTQGPRTQGPARGVWRALRRAISWHRRVAAMASAGIAVLALVAALAPKPPPTEAVVVAVQAIASGAQISAADISVRQVPAAAVPDAAARSVDEVLNRVLRGPATAGQILTTVSVVAPRDGTDGGTVTAPLRLADAAAVSFLAAGDVVDVLAADPRTGTSTVVAPQVRIAAIPSTPAGGGGMLSGPERQPLILVEVSPQVATTLAAAAVSSQLSVTWRS